MFYDFHFYNIGDDDSKMLNNLISTFQKFIASGSEWLGGQTRECFNSVLIYDSRYRFFTKSDINFIQFSIILNGIESFRTVHYYTFSHIWFEYNWLYPIPKSDYLIYKIIYVQRMSLSHFSSTQDLAVSNTSIWNVIFVELYEMEFLRVYPNWSALSALLLQLGYLGLVSLLSPHPLQLNYYGLFTNTNITGQIQILKKNLTNHQVANDDTKNHIQLSPKFIISSPKN